MKCWAKVKYLISITQRHSILLSRFYNILYQTLINIFVLEYYDGPKGGLCNDESELIRSEPDCKEALEALGYGPLKKFWITPGSLLNPQIPAGCSIHAASSTPHLSTTSGAGRGREDLTPICSRNKGKGINILEITRIID